MQYIGFSMKFCFMPLHTSESFNFSKKFWELHIIFHIIFQELFSESNYLDNFLNYIVMKYYKRKQSYCS